jgi:hypothetical protein
VAHKLGVDMVWFGVLLAVNMQTSFMHPPFGFALFYLRSVAPLSDYIDKITGKRIAKVTTGQIYYGAIPFVLIQIVMVALVISFPGLVTGGLGKTQTIDADKAFEQMQEQSRQSEEPAPAAPAALPAQASQPEASAAPSLPAPPADDDPMKALQESMQKDAAKK